MILLSLFPFLFLFTSFDGNPRSMEKEGLHIPTVHVVPRIYVDSLPAEIHESSALLWWDSLLWTINDSGGENILYGYAPRTNSIVRRVVVENASNHDWESLARDERFIYIGDFGNNAGWRKDLRIFRIPYPASDAAGKEQVEAEVISFRYPEQRSFIRLPLATRWDCEAFIAVDDTLYLFTKDWKWEQTSLYLLPGEPGDYDAQLADSFFLRGLVTGAALSPDGKTLVLSGYESFYPYLWVFYDFPGHRFFRGKVLRVRYPEFFRAQTEGVTFLDGDTILVSSETNVLPGRIYAFSLKAIMAARRGSDGEPNLR